MVKKYIIAIVIYSIIFLTGCFSNFEINELGNILLIKDNILKTMDLESNKSWDVFTNLNKKIVNVYISNDNRLLGVNAVEKNKYGGYKHNIFIYDINNKKKIKTIEEAVLLDISPDNKITYKSQMTNDIGRVYNYDLENNKSYDLYIENPLCLSWSNDGNNFVYIKESSSFMYKLLVKNINTKKEKQLFMKDFFNIHYCYWDNSNNKIFFVASLKNSTVEIYSVNSNGENLFKITSNKLTEESPIVSYNGEKLLFSSVIYPENRDLIIEEKDIRYDLYIMDINDNNIKKLNEGSVSAYKAKWINK